MNTAPQITVLSVSCREGSARYTVVLQLLDPAHENREEHTFTLLGAFLPFDVAAGMTLDTAAYEALERGDGVSRAVMKGADLLDLADHTAKLLIQKLLLRGFSRNDAEDAVAYLEKKGMLREDAYLVRQMHYLCEKKLLGPGRIGAELAKKGFSRTRHHELYAETLETLDFDVALRRRVRAIGVQQLNDPTDPKRQKHFAALQRYGFYGTDIRRVIKEETEEQENRL